MVTTAPAGHVAQMEPTGSMASSTTATHARDLRLQHRQLQLIQTFANTWSTAASRVARMTRIAVMREACAGRALVDLRMWTESCITVTSAMYQHQHHHDDTQ